MKFRFACDCTFRAKANVLLVGVLESGTYEIDEDEIVFHRPSSVSRWPYRFEDNRLVLTEYEGEEHRYRQTESRRCTTEVADEGPASAP